MDREKRKALRTIKNSNKRKRKKTSGEIKLILDTLTFIFIAIIGLRYLPPEVLLRFEWLLGNQMFRMGLILLGIALIVVNSVFRRKSGSIIVFVTCVVLVVEIFVYIPLISLAKEPEYSNLDRDQYIRTFTLNCGTRETDTIVEYLTENDIDLVSLQEVPSRDYKKLLKSARKAGYQGVYQQLRRDSGMGVVVLSKGEITHIDSISAESFGWNWRVFPVVKTILQGREIEVIGVQLESIDRKRDLGGVIESWKYRLIQANLISRIAKENEGPFLVMGDFNATATDRSIAPIRKQLRDSWISAGKGIGATWNKDKPFFRIDHIMYRDFATALNGKITPLLESDHLAYQADLVLPKE